MSYYYALPNFTNSWSDSLTYANTVTGNLFGISTLIMVFLITYIPLNRKYDFTVCLTTASFITTIVSYFILILGLIGSHIILFPTFLFLLSLFLLYKNR